MICIAHGNKYPCTECRAWQDARHAEVGNELQQAVQKALDITEERWRAALMSPTLLDAVLLLRKVAKSLCSTEVT